MSEPINERERIEALEAENNQLRKVNEALMNRVEKSTDEAGSAYSLFESNLLLQNKVKEHSDKFVQINRDLQQEIREHKKTEEKLRLYHRIFTASKDSMAIMSPDGSVVEMNPANQYFISQIKKSFWSLKGKVKLEDKRLQEVEKALKIKGQYRGEFKCEFKDGNVAYVDITISPVLNEEKEIQYLVAMGRNITQTIKAQNALATRLRYEKGLAGCSQSLLVTGDLDKDICKALHFLLEAADVGRVYIFENEEVPGKELCCSQKYEVCAPGVSVELDNPILQKIPYTGGIKLWYDALSRNKHYGDLTKNIQRDLAEILEDQNVLSILIIPVWIDGQWYGFIGLDEVKKEREWGDEEIRLLRTASEIIGMYLSRRKAFDNLAEANKNIKEAQIQLIHSEKMASLGMLVAGIAHEINTPLGSINSMHDTLMRATEKLKGVLAIECDENSPYHNQVESIVKIIDDANCIIRDGTERVTTIVRRLRSFARLDQGELDEEADIHEGMEDTLTLIHHEIKHNITIHKKFGTIPKITCRLSQLNQVFVNLLINAKQAIQEKGAITIETKADKDYITIKFTDTGQGISPEKLNHVFDPGFTTKGVGVGTGLGLSICYQIVQEHYGKISVESEVGKGSTFTVVLPTNLPERLAEAGKKGKNPA